MLVLDTSALLMWTYEPQRLSREASRAIRAAPVLLVSSISVWEVGVKVKKGGLQIPHSVVEFCHRLQSVERVEVLAVDAQTWLENLALRWDHRDPADRTIVATAVLRGCPLVTSDGRMKAFYPLAIW